MNQENLDGGQEMDIERVGYFNNRQVFRKEQEDLLKLLTDGIINVFCVNST